MTDDDIDFENFDEKNKEEKIQKLRELHNKLAQGDEPSGLLQDVDVEGRLTAKVISEDGEEKAKESTEFKIGE